jgi:5-methylcytosine-specific restriction enzyme subunit McrC
MWHMPTLFQEFVRGLLASSRDVTLIEDRPPRATIFDARHAQRRSSKVDPDLVARIGTGPTLLIDTKYKDVLPSGSKDDEGDDDRDEKLVTPVDKRHKIQLTRSDVYQAVAYRHHDKWPSSQSALLYPLVLAEGDTLPKPMQVRGFGEPISLLFIDIGRHASANLTAFFSELQGFAGEAADRRAG